MSETTVPFALYDAFSDSLFGGSQGAIVLNAGNIKSRQRQQIASELGFPATCFVSSVKQNTITARFHSTEREYPMCGHGTICLISHLLAIDLLQPGDDGKSAFELVLPTKTAMVEVLHHDNGNNLVMLDIASPKLRPDDLDTEILAALLGLSAADMSSSYPVETALGDFTHLIVPVKTLEATQSIQPDFAAMKAYCREYGYETIACFSTETTQTGFDFHVRDFCPAVGVPESAAAGTTNAALATYWHKYRFIPSSGTEPVSIKVEQGLELGRPSTIHTILHTLNDDITRLQVGGVARKVIEGHLQLSETELKN